MSSSPFLFHSERSIVNFCLFPPFAWSSSSIFFVIFPLVVSFVFSNSICSTFHQVSDFSLFPNPLIRHFITKRSPKAYSVSLLSMLLSDFFLILRLVSTFLHHTLPLVDTWIKHTACLRRCLGPMRFYTNVSRKLHAELFITGVEPGIISVEGL